MILFGAVASAALAQDPEDPLKELAASKELKQIEGLPELRRQQGAFSLRLRSFESDVSVAARRQAMEQDVRTIEASPEQAVAIEKQCRDLEVAKK